MNDPDAGLREALDPPRGGPVAPPPALLAWAEAASAVSADETADFADLYERLRGTARRYFRRQPQDHTLGPTALVHEAFVRIATSCADGEAPTGEHLAALCATAMRHVLVDHARRRAARARAMGSLAGTSGAGRSATPGPEEILALDEALTALREANEAAARLVELRIFCGLGLAEAAQAMGIARSTASERWRVARAWLAAQMGAFDDDR